MTISEYMQIDHFLLLLSGPFILGYSLICYLSVRPFIFLFFKALKHDSSDAQIASTVNTLN